MLVLVNSLTGHDADGQTSSTTLAAAPVTAAVTAPGNWTVIGNGLVAKRIILASLKSALDTYTADPHKIVEPTARLQAYLEKLGSLKKPVDLKTLFDARLYDAASAQKP